MELSTSRTFFIRFSEVDSMNVVWHGSYALYFEDAREKFGAEFGLSYQTFVEHRCFAPVVEMTCNYKQPIRYGMVPRIDIVYRPTESAKMVFDYRIVNTEDGSVIALGHSVQVFMDMDYQLLWEKPDFYRQWQERWKVFE